MEMAVSLDKIDLIWYDFKEYWPQCLEPACVHSFEEPPQVNVSNKWIVKCFKNEIKWEAPFWTLRWTLQWTFSAIVAQNDSIESSVSQQEGVCDKDYTGKEQKTMERKAAKSQRDANNLAQVNMENARSIVASLKRKADLE